MTYSGDSRIATRAQATAAQIQAWLEDGADGGAGYVGLPRFSIPGDTGPAIVRYSNEWNVNSDLLAALCAHESAFFQSLICRDKNNPGGYGAENDDPYNKAIAFATMADGVRAVAAHLAGYVHGDGEWTQYSPRYPIVKANGWAGSVAKLTDLNGKWAWPGTTYGQSLARVANDLLAFVVQHPDREEPSGGSIQKPPMIQKPSPNRDGYGTPRRIEAICNHIATGTKDSNLSWLTNADSGASCNAYIAKDGTVYELLPPESSPWTNGVVNQPDMDNPLIAAWVQAGISPNTRCYTIEHEGEPGDGLTAAQMTSNNAVTAWVSFETGMVLDRVHIIGHYQIDSVDRPYCPSFSETEWAQLIDGARALFQPGVGQPAKPHPTARWFPLTGQYISQGFRSTWEQFNDDRVSIMVFGYPLTGELPFTTADGKQGAQQCFERAVFEWHPDDGVLLRRLGAEILESLE